MNYLETKNIITDPQHGFWTKRSCEFHFIITFHDFTRLLDRRDFKQVDIIVLDFLKAFDKGPH